MEKTMTKLGLASLFILITACGKAPEMKTPNEGKSAQPLEGKTNSEIIAEKYSKISLDCSVRVKKGPAIDLNADPTDSFSWELPGVQSGMKVLNFRQGNIDTIVVVKITEALKFVDTNSVVDEKQNEYFMEHSPVVTVSFRHDSKKILVNGQVHDSFRFKNAKLSENVETRFFTITSEDNDRNQITEDFRCTLNTKMNPAYAHQWKKVR